MADNLNPKVNDYKDREIWTAQEVADYLRCTARHVTACANRKELPGFKVGNIWRFRAKDIQGLTEGDK